MNWSPKASREPKVRHTVPPAHPVEIVAGLVLLVFGLGILALAVFWVVAILRQGGAPESHLVVIATVLTAVGLFCTKISYRLLLRRGRDSDGGLFSPTFLRVSGLVFLLYPVLAFSLHPLGWLSHLPTLFPGLACFALARHREQHLRNADPVDPAT